MLGFLSGLVFMPSIAPFLSRGNKKAEKIMTIMFFAIGLFWSIVLFVIFILVYYENKDGNSFCEWCRYLNCIPGMPWCAEKCKKLNAIFL